MFALEMKLIYSTLIGRDRKEFDLQRLYPHSWIIWTYFYFPKYPAAYSDSTTEVNSTELKYCMKNMLDTSMTDASNYTPLKESEGNCS